MRRARAVGRDDAEPVADGRRPARARCPSRWRCRPGRRRGRPRISCGWAIAGDGGEVLGRDAEDLDAGVAALEGGHDLALDQGGGAGDAGDLRRCARPWRRRPGSCGSPGPGRPSRAVGVDRDMGVGAEDRVHELLAEARADGERGDQREDGEGDADEADPGHHRDAALGALGAQVAPGDHPFVGGEGGGHRGPFGRAGPWPPEAGKVNARAADGPSRSRYRAGSPSRGCRGSGTGPPPALRPAPCPARPRRGHGGASRRRRLRR